MSNTDRFVQLNIGQWSRPDAERPRLDAPISATATTLTFTKPFKNEDDDIVRGDVLEGVQDRKGYTESIFIPSGTLNYDGQTANFTEELWVTGGTSGARAKIINDSDSGATGILTLAFVEGVFQNNELITDTAGGSATVNGVLTPAISADGLTATNCVRGVDLSGLDFTTQNNPDLAVKHDADDAVICQISAVYVQMLISALMGDIATGGNGFIMGNGTDVNAVFYHKDGTSVKGFLRKDPLNEKVEFSDDGISWTYLGASGNHGTTAPLKDHGDVATSVSDSPADGDLLVYVDADNEWKNKTQDEIIGVYIQNNSNNFGTSTTGNDTYVFNPTPAVTTLENGQRFLVKVDTANTGACTLNVSGLGAVAIKLNSGGDPETGDIPANSIIDVVYNSTGPKFVLQGTPALLTNNTDASLHHYHDPARNNHYSNRLSHRVDNFEPLAAGGTEGFNNSTYLITTAASNNALGTVYFACNTLIPTITQVSVHNKNPEFWLRGGFASNAAQEGFIGFHDYTMVGTSLENAAMTLDHFGFIVQDATLFISCADGATQTKTDISGLVTNVNVMHTYRAYFDGTTAFFFVDGVSVGSITTNVPDGNLERCSWSVIADASAAAKTFRIWKGGLVSMDVI